MLVLTANLEFASLLQHTGYYYMSKRNLDVFFILYIIKEGRKGFSLHARAESTHAITKMYASAK